MQHQYGHDCFHIWVSYKIVRHGNNYVGHKNTTNIAFYPYLIFIYIYIQALAASGEMSNRGDIDDHKALY